MTEARRLTRALQGKWYGRYGLARCPAHGDKNPSLSLADGPNGRLLAHCKTGCSFADVLEALRGLGLVKGTGRVPSTDPVKLACHAAEQRREAEKRAWQALAVWREAQPIEGTPAARYLREVRRITAPPPTSLRFHPACWHGPSARKLPAMVALVEGAERFAVHRTFLRPDGLGKADVESGTAKMMLGATQGGAVRLTQADGLVVAEGIETALALASGLLRHPVTIWAALSTSGMKALRLPPQPGRLTVATDGDPAGREAGNALAERATALGWSVSLLPAPDGRDWADILMTNRTAA